MMKKVLIVGVVVLAVWILCFFSVTGICTFVLFGKHGEDLKIESSQNVYRFRRLNYEKNESLTGFVSIFHQLEEDEYLYYKDFGGSDILISKFGNNEYHCRGSCYCEQERRISISSARYGVSFLVAAISSLVALNRAKEYFREDCKLKLEDQCFSPSSIKSDVDSCEDIIEEGDVPNDEVEKELSEEYREMKETEENFRVYFCRGHCIPKGRLQRESAKKIAREICVDLKELGWINVFEEEVTFSHAKKPNWKRGNTVAVEKFQKQILVPFCRERSVRTYWYTHRTIKKGVWRSVSVCVGRGNTVAGWKKNIHCLQAYPGYKSDVAYNGRKYWKKKGFESEEPES